MEEWKELFCFHRFGVGKNANVRNSVILPGTIIGEGAFIERAIIGHGVMVDEGYTLRGAPMGCRPIAVVSDNSVFICYEKYMRKAAAK